MTLHRPYTVAATDPGTPDDLTPEDAGWSWTGLRVLVLAPGEERTIRTGESEAFVLPLAGSLSFVVDDEAGSTLGDFTLQGRESVFTAVTDFGYVGRDSVVVL